jgi:succinyl-CoA synthetase beta subunit
MKIHEYQGKEILRNYGVPVPRGIPAFTVQEAVEAAQKLGGPVWVVKAQIHAGGRGKGGGVKVAKTIEDVKRIAGEILGMQLKTHQTGPEGQKVRRLYIEDGADINKEYYISAVTDRESQKWPSSLPAKAAWTSKRWLIPIPKKSSRCLSIRWSA